jgi:glycosyltransferase involved in cell wall biosynthesis
VRAGGRVGRPALAFEAATGRSALHAPPDPSGGAPLALWTEFAHHRPVRLVYVTQVRLDTPHGGPRHVHAVVRGLARSGHAVTLIGPGDDTVPADLSRLRRIRPGRTLAPGARLELALAGSVARAVFERSPEVACVRICPSTSAVPETLARLSVPFWLELNGRVIEEMRRSGAPTWKQAMAQASLQWACRRAAGVVAVAENIAEHARRVLRARRVEIIENGADTETAIPGDRTEARRELQLPPGVPIVAFAGSFVPEQQLSLLFEAVLGMPAEVRLILAGDGPGRAQVEAAARAHPNRIQYWGPVAHERAVKLLQAATLCANARDGDLGMKPFEAAAVGRRIVVFEAPGVRRLTELYRPEDRGVEVVQARSAEALRAGIARAIEAESQGPIPRATVERVRRAVGWDRAVDQLEALFQQSADGSCRRALTP